MSWQDEEFSEVLSGLTNMASTLTENGEYQARSPTGTDALALLPRTPVAGHEVYPLILVSSEPSYQQGDAVVRATVYLLDPASPEVIRKSLSSYYEAAGTEAGRFIRPDFSDWEHFGVSHVLRSGDPASLQELQHLQYAIWHWRRYHSE